MSKVLLRHSDKGLTHQKCFFTLVSKEGGHS